MTMKTPTHVFSIPVSIFVCLIGVWLFSPAHAATFARILGASDPFPDDTRTVRQIREVVFDESGANEFMVLLIAGFEPGSFEALYRVDAADRFQRIAATGTATSRGAVIASLGSYTLHGAAVYFWGLDAASNGYLCKVTEPAGTATVIAAKGDLIAANDRFESFGGLSAYAGGLVFDGFVNRNNFARTFNDVFHYDGSDFTSLIGFGTKPVPGTTGAVFFMDKDTAPLVRNNEIVFLGEGIPFNFGSIRGLYALPLPGRPGALRKLVDIQDKAPGSTRAWTTIGRNLSQLPLFDVDSEGVAFFAAGFQDADAGFYLHTEAGGLTTVADGDTTVPGGTEKFLGMSFAQGELSLSGNRLVFQMRDGAGNSGIYQHANGSLEKVIAGGDEVDGQPLFQFRLDPRGLSGDHLVFYGNETLYRTVLGGDGSTPIPVALQITRTGNQVAISWDAAAAGPGAELQSTASLAAPDWQKVSGQTNPFLANPTAAAQYFRLKQ